MDTLYKIAKCFKVKPNELIKFLESGGFEKKTLTSELDSTILKYINDYFNSEKELFEAEKLINYNLEIDEIDFEEADDIINYVNANKESLSIRAQNILNDKILVELRQENFVFNSLTQLDYFLGFKNVGRKTAEELSCFFENCNVVKDTLLLSQNEKLKFELQKNKMFTSNTILSLISLNVNKLSVCSRRRIKLIMSEIKNDIDNFFKYLDIASILKIKYIRAKSAAEISFFLQEILELFKNNEFTLNYKLNLLLHDLHINVNQRKYIIDENTLPSYFKIFELYFENNKKKLRYLIVLKYLDGDNYADIGAKLNLSRERIRQIIYRFDDKLFEIIVRFNNIISKSEIDFTDSISEGKQIGSETIIKKYDINLHPKIIEKLLNPKISIRKLKYLDYENEELSKFFDIKTMINKLIELNKKVETDFELSLNGFLFNYLLDKENAHQIDKFRSQIEDLIFEKTRLVTNVDGALIFQKNTKTKKYNAIVELLMKYGRPMHLDEISEITGLKKENIRGTFLKERHLFVNTALSTYGLKKWEDEGKIKGGTIIDLVYEYLNSKPEPSHLYQIYKYIKQFRDTTERSIDGLIKSDTQNRFLQLGAGFYGLIGVHDDFKFKVFKPLPGNWHNHLNKNYQGINVTLDQFINKEKLKSNVHELVIKANVEKRIDLGDIKIDDNGLLIFKKYIHSQKSGRPKLIV